MFFFFLMSGGAVLVYLSYCGQFHHLVLRGCFFSLVRQHTNTQLNLHTYARAHKTHARSKHTHTHTHTHIDTQTHRHTDTQTHRHTDTQTHRHTDTNTHTHTHKRDYFLRFTVCIWGFRLILITAVRTYNEIWCLRRCPQPSLGFDTKNSWSFATY